MKIGVWGAVVTALCCFTPILVWLLPALGLAAAVAWLDWVLFPLLGLFLIIAAVAWLKGRQK